MKNMLARKSNTELAPKVDSTLTIREELEDHVSVMDARVAAAEFACYIEELELNEWSRMARSAERISERSSDIDEIDVANRLQVTAEGLVRKSETRLPELQEVLEQLKSTRKRATAALGMIDKENKFKALNGISETGMFNNVAQQDIEQETREIRRLRHTSDALIELNR